MAVADMNFVILTGVATKDAIARRRSTGQLKSEFSFEVDRPFLKPDGDAVSDLFLIDAWGPLAEWAVEHVRRDVRLLVVGTLNKESYRTRGGAKEHISIVKAKYLGVVNDSAAEGGIEVDELRKDAWEVPVIVRNLRTFLDSLEGSDEAGPANGRARTSVAEQAIA
jgi:single-stranded DNA-binding protein